MRLLRYARYCICDTHGHVQKELETGNDRQNMEMVVRQSTIVVLPGAHLEAVTFMTFEWPCLHPPLSFYSVCFSVC